MFVALVALTALVGACSGGSTGAVSSPTSAEAEAVTTLSTVSTELPGAVTTTVPPVTEAFDTTECRAEQPSLLVVGDSVLQGAQSALHVPLRDRFDVTYDALRDRPTPTATAIVGSTPLESRDVVVVGVGYNDQADGDEYLDLASDMLDETEGSELVLWLTLSSARSNYPGVNETLEDMTLTHPELELVEWGEIADEVAEYTVSDGIHLTGTGAEALTELVLSHLDDWLAITPVCPGLD